MTVQFKKPKAVALVKWFIKKGMKKLQEQCQQAIKEKDSGLAQRNNQAEALEDERQ